MAYAYVKNPETFEGFKERLSKQLPKSQIHIYPCKTWEDIVCEFGRSLQYLVKAGIDFHQALCEVEHTNAHLCLFNYPYPLYHIKSVGKLELHNYKHPMTSLEEIHGTANLEFAKADLPMLKRVGNFCLLSCYEKDLPNLELVEGSLDVNRYWGELPSLKEVKRVVSGLRNYKKSLPEKCLYKEGIIL